jgi:5-methylthioribose kinase
MIDVANAGALIVYLRERHLLHADEMPHVSALSGGISSNTMLVRRALADNLVVKQALPRLRVAVDWFSDPRRIHHEALGMKWLGRFCPSGSITTLVFEDFDEHLLVMQAVREPHQNYKDLLLAGNLRFYDVIRFAEMLAAIHRESFLQREIVAPIFGDRSFFETLRVEPYYRYSAARVPESASFLAELVAETFDTRLSLVHGDYSPKYILISHGKMVLLDHEVIHFGDPAFDMGCALAHLLSKAHHLRDKRPAFVQAALLFAERYLGGLNGLEWRTTMESRAVRHTIACLLARVAGRSTLEYLSVDERVRQQKITQAMMKSPAKYVSDLINEFHERLNCQ